MVAPDLLPAKVLFFLIILGTIIVSIQMLVKFTSITARCEFKKEEIGKKQNLDWLIITIVIICVLGGLASQTMNRSYSFDRYGAKT